MNLLRRLALIPVSLAIWAAPLVAQPPPDRVDEFLPIDQLPPGEGLPAAPFLIAAYVFVWLAAMFYLWTIWRRIQKVEHEMQTLRQRRGSGTH